MFEFWRETTATSVPGLLCQSGRRRPENVSILSSLIGNDDDNGSENVAKRMNLRSFKLNRVYLDRSICQIQATFPGAEFLRILFKFKKRKENSSSHVHFLHKTAN